MDERVTVKLVVPSVHGGGAERVVRIVADAIEHEPDLGVGAEIVALLDETAPSAPRGAAIRVLGARRVRSALLPLIRLVRAEQPDAVLTTLKHVSGILGLAAVLMPRRTRHVARVANTYSKELEAVPAWRRGVTRQVLRLGHRTIDGFICVSAGVRDDIVRELQIDPARCTVILNPVDVDEVTSLSEAPLGDVVPARVRNAPVRFVAVGRLEPQKDHAALLGALAVVRRGHDASLVLVGDGSLRSQLEADAARLGVSSWVHFAGFQDNPYPYLRNASALVLSSRYEGMPNVLLEALALGIPCVSTDCPHGPSEVIIDDRLGLLVAPGDSDALAMAMSAVADRSWDPDFAVRHVRERHDVQTVMHQYVGALLGERWPG